MRHWKNNGSFSDAPVTHFNVASLDFPYSKLSATHSASLHSSQRRVSSTQTVYNRGNQGGNGRVAGRKKATTVNTKQGATTARSRTSYLYDGNTKHDGNNSNGSGI